MAPTALVGLALVGLAQDASAGDLDDVAPFAAAELPDQLVGPSVQERRGSGGGTRSASRSNGHRTVTRTTQSNGHGGQRSKTTATNNRGASHSNTTSNRPPPQRRAGDHDDHHGAGGAQPVRPGHAADRPGSGSGNSDHARQGPGVYGHPQGRPGAHHPRVMAHSVRYHHVRPYHGVFVYGPRPSAHVRYVGAPGPVRVVQDDLPERAVDRNNSFALGIKGGSLISGTEHVVYGDPGIGGLARFRPDESVGLQFDLSHHWGHIPETERRTQTQLAGSLALFAFPWAPVSPYVIGGATWNDRSVTHEEFDGASFTSKDSGYDQWGLHAGLGLELALGKSVALDLEGRYVGWLQRDKGDAPGALQTTAGLLVHF
jgi:hypothetical protein